MAPRRDEEVNPDQTAHGDTISPRLDPPEPGARATELGELTGSVDTSNRGGNAMFSPQIKDEKTYRALRREGNSEEKPAQRTSVP